MKTTIEIDRLRIYAYHGVMEQETKVGNFFEVSLSIDYPFENAITSDNLTDTASYASMCELIKKEMAIPSKLLEHVAGRIIASLKLQFPQIESGKIKITKVKPPIQGQLSGVSIVIEW
ncbi:MAG: dihydroneopterin aldolase [Muribaculaceae bacterium]|nr:dihydroneopterin aldolase [Muribaculaceae bacterium]